MYFIKTSIRITFLTVSAEMWGGLFGKLTWKIIWIFFVFLCFLSFLLFRSMKLLKKIKVKRALSLSLSRVKTHAERAPSDFHSLTPISHTKNECFFLSRWQLCYGFVVNLICSISMTKKEKEKRSE